MNKILIISPDFEMTRNLGGVGSYYKVLRHYFSESVIFHSYKPINYKNPLMKGVSRLSDIFSITRNLKNDLNIKLIVLNPSLNWASLIRDGLSLIFISKSCKNRIIFFRGWHEYMENAIDRYSIIKYFFKLIYRKSEVLIVLSKTFKQKLREWGFEQPVYVETTVVDDNLISYLELNSYNNVDKTFNILFLARVEMEKGILETIETFQILQKKHVNIQLTIAGDGNDLTAAKDFVNKKGLKNICFKGYITGLEKASVFKKSDLYFFPSYGEGMPNSVLEAMAFGLPVITRPVGGINDFFEDGKMGYLNESKNPVIFAQLIEKLILNPVLCRNISNYNSAFACKHFMASYVAKRLERIYMEVIDGCSKDNDWMNIDGFVPMSSS